MARYYISTGLWQTDIFEFPNDRVAWEELRKILPHKFGTLLRETEVVVPVNNEESYIEKYNSKYGPRPYGYGPDDAKLMKVGEKNIHIIFVPILEGITDDKYNVRDEFDRMLMKEVPKNMLTDIEFGIAGNMSKLDAILYIKKETNCSLKTAKCYYDLYLSNYV